MTETRVAIYISELTNPFYTMEVQEKYCRMQAEKMNYEHIMVFKDTVDRTNLTKLLNEINFYDCLIVFSLMNLGENYKDIINRIEQIFMDNTGKFLTFSEPVFLTSLQDFIREKTIMSSIMMVIIKSSNKWREIKEYETSLSK